MSPSRSEVQRAVNAVLAAAPREVRWSICLTGGPVGDLRINANTPMMTASMGKVFLLLALAEAIEVGSISSDELLTIEPEDEVADSGLWQYLSADSLTMADAAVLVAAVSDNLATNVLLRRVGLSEVQAVSRRLGMPQTQMLDRIRDTRGSADPSGPSQSTAAHLARLMADIGTAEPGSPAGRVRHWLSLNTDLSMVSAALRLDPLAHADGHFVSKTGSDLTIRADAGYWAAGGVAYAVLANWDQPADSTAHVVVDTMRALGEIVFAAPST